MNSPKIIKHVRAISEANKAGILGLYSNNQVQLDTDEFLELSKETPNLLLYETRNETEYPHQVSFLLHGYKFLSIFTDEEFQKIFGGRLDELVTEA